MILGPVKVSWWLAIFCMSVTIPVTCSICFAFCVNSLHNVYLSTWRPPHASYISSQHPECRPYSLTSRKCYSCFNISVCKCKFAIGIKSCRCIIHSTIRLLLGSDMQCSPWNIRIIRPVSIILLFIISPSARTCSYFIPPFRCINRCPVKLIAPYQFRWRCRCCCYIFWHLKWCKCHWWHNQCQRQYRCCRFL